MNWFDKAADKFNAWFDTLTQEEQIEFLFDKWDYDSYKEYLHHEWDDTKEDE